MFLSKNNILNMLFKTSASYLISCAISGHICYKLLKRYKKYILHDNGDDEYLKIWELMQVFSTALLVVAWLFFSVSNITVFLPRKLEQQDFLMFLCVIIFTIASVLGNKNNKMQEIISKKNNANNLKMNVIINILFTMVLFLFKVINNVSIATTFVFLGILAGKDLAIIFAEKNILGSSYRRVIFNSLKDINKCITGVIVSLTFVALINSLNVL
jgi:hypothetical protein